MRRLTIAAAAVLFTLGTALADGTVSTTDPTVDPRIIGNAKPPAPPANVYVVNLPDVQAVTGVVSVDNLPAVWTVGGTVSVSNLPAVQSVSGTVSVGNLPAVQSVAGAVSVSNLPLDSDGAMRVSPGLCPTTPPLQAQFVDLLPDGPISLNSGQEFVSAVVDARGYSRIGITGKAGNAIDIFIEWTWSNITDLFAPVTDTRNGSLTTSSCVDFIPVPQNSFIPQRQRFVCVVSGEQVRLHAYSPAYGESPLTELGVYLIP